MTRWRVGGLYGHYAWLAPDHRYVRRVPVSERGVGATVAHRVAQVPHPGPGHARTVGTVLGYIKAHPGSRSEVIKKALGMAPPQMGDALKRLVASKSVKTKGQKRATTYFAT